MVSDAMTSASYRGRAASSAPSELTVNEGRPGQKSKVGYALAFYILARFPIGICSSKRTTSSEGR